jgi:hypothetical protein
MFFLFNPFHFVFTCHHFVVCLLTIFRIDPTNHAAASRPPIDNSEPLCTPNPPPSRDTNDPPQNLDINHSAEEQKPAATASPKPTPTSSKKRRSSASASHLFDAAVSKKRTFSLKECVWFLSNNLMNLFLFSPCATIKPLNVPTFFKAIQQTHISFHSCDLFQAYQRYRQLCF